MNKDVTQYLEAISRGDPSAAGQLLPLVYDELRQLAALRMRRESPDHTLQPTALVHEAFVRLAGADAGQKWDNRGHFFAAAAEAMRRILVDDARRKRTTKHGGGMIRHTLDDANPAAKSDDPESILALDEALTRLAVVEPELARLVQLRYFTGLSVEEAATALGVSARTVKRNWCYARAWLRRDIERDTGRDTGHDDEREPGPK